MKHLRLFAVLFAIVIFATACTGGAASPSADDGEVPASEPAESEAAEAPDELIIGFVPSREADALVEDIEPVAEFLSEELGIPVTGFVSTDYTGLVTAMEADRAHIGAFNPLGLLQAVERADAEIILQSERFGSGTYHTQFFTNNPDKYCTDEPEENIRVVDDEEVTYLNCNGTARANDETPEGPVGLDALADLEVGSTVSFVTQNSASGYIFPATIFATQGFDPETDIEPFFSESHENSVVTVCEGGAEVGVSFDDARTETGDLTECDVASEVVVFAYGPEIPNDGIAISGSLPDDLKDRIKQALLDFAESEEGQTVLGEIYNITAFTEPDLGSLEIVRAAVDELGLSE